MVISLLLLKYFKFIGRSSGIYIRELFFPIVFVYFPDVSISM